MISIAFDSCNPALLISIISSAIAITSLIFSIYSWRQTHRPLLSARITSVSGGNMGIALNIVVENSGNRPARDIRLLAREADVLAAMSQNRPPSIPKDADRCFFHNKIIPVLANGRAVTNSFGFLGSNQNGSWRAGARIPIRIKYRDLGRRKFSSRLTLLLSDDAGFAQTFWGGTENKSS